MILLPHKFSLTIGISLMLSLSAMAQETDSTVVDAPAAAASVPMDTVAATAVADQSVSIAGGGTTASGGTLLAADSLTADSLASDSTAVKGKKKAKTPKEPKAPKEPKPKKEKPKPLLSQLGQAEAQAYQKRMEKERKERKKAMAQLIKQFGDPARLEDTIRRRRVTVGMPEKMFNDWYSDCQYVSSVSNGTGTLRELNDSVAVMWQLNHEQRKQLMQRLHAAYMDCATRAIDSWEILNKKLTLREEKSRRYDRDRVPGGLTQTQRLEWLKKESTDRQKRLWQYYDTKRKTYELFSEFENKLSVTNPDTNSVNAAFVRDSVFTDYYRSLQRNSFWDRWSIRSNMLGWLFTVPNLEVEFDFSAHPKGSWSILIGGQFNPNTNNIRNWNNRPRADLNVIGGHGEIRKYWRTGGLSTINRSDVWYNAEKGHGDFNDHGFYDDNYDFFRFRQVFYDIHDTVIDGTQVRDTLDSVVNYTNGWLYRKWAPLRYQRLSGRYLNKPRQSRVYYFGLQGGANKYLWVLGRKGRQGKELYGGVSGGVVTHLFNFNRGGALELELGLCLALQYERYEKFEYSGESGCYHILKIVGPEVKYRPVLKDVHATIVYAFRGMANKVNQIYHVLDYADKAAIRTAKQKRVKRDMALARDKEVLLAGAEQDYTDRVKRERELIVELTSNDSLGRARLDTISAQGRVIDIRKIYVDEIGDYHIVNGRKIYHPLRIVGATDDERRKSYEEQKAARSRQRKEAEQEDK